MKIKAEITESIVIQKKVAVEVPEDATDSDIDDAIRAEAYRLTIFDHPPHGWEGIETLDVNVKWELI